MSPCENYKVQFN